MGRKSLPLFVLFLGFLLVWPEPSEAYIGPGAGIAFVSSFLIVLATLALAVVTLLTWPFRWALQTFRGRKALTKARVQRVIVLGLDGQDPELTDQFLKEGILPNFARLRDQGGYWRLKTVLPAESPVAWSSFQTGCNPGRHRVFDFLVPNRKSYLPELCSARIEPPPRSLSLGKYKIPLGKPRIRFERKSQSFWKILGDHGVFSSILRVPISFPPEKFRGVLLSAMSTPDLLGTQGTFAYYSSDPAEEELFTGGVQILVEAGREGFSSEIAGPENPLVPDQGAMKIPFSLESGQESGSADLTLGEKQYRLKLGQFSPWIELEFKAGLGMKVRGICRFFLKQTTPHWKLYVSPINIDPENPALPISQPVTYSMYLAKTQGPFNTLGLSEDTWALNERVLDEDAFLAQTYSVHEERKRMFFDALDKTRKGSVVCVFDITDRLQHMFWRYLEPEHPANRDKERERHRDAIRQLYKDMDELVGQTLDQVGEEDVLFVMSDHGFKPFRRGINLNSWLYENGYLAVKQGPSGQEWFQEVDWSRTRAFAVGLGGIYLNLKGREAQGIVAPGEEARELKKEIREKLSQLIDPETGKSAIAAVYDTVEAYQGPYVAEAPDLITGFRVGYRASWTCATGAVTDSVFEDNIKSWSGDHCMNPPDVPGILLCTRKIQKEAPSILDLGPTILDLFGVPVPAYCDGSSLMPSQAEISRNGKTPEEAAA